MLFLYIMMWPSSFVLATAIAFAGSAREKCDGQASYCMIINVINIIIINEVVFQNIAW